MQPIWRGAVVSIRTLKPSFSTCFMASMVIFTPKKSPTMVIRPSLKTSTLSTNQPMTVRLLGAVSMFSDIKRSIAAAISYLDRGLNFAPSSSSPFSKESFSLSRRSISDWRVFEKFPSLMNVRMFCVIKFLTS